MKRNSLTLLLAAGMLLAGVQTTKAQKVVLHMKGNQTFECSISQLDSITFCFDAPSMNPKVRLGIYEAIPGYDVQNVEFYTDAATDITQTSCVLYADTNDEVFTIDFGTLNTYPLGTTSANVTFAGNIADNYYTFCSPNEEGTDLTLRANYKLIASDGSGEVINVTNASAQVPAEYTKWEYGRAYTYIFKITEHTPWTADQNVSDLYPISLDAIVVDNSDGSQQVITR